MKRYPLATLFVLVSLLLPLVPGVPTTAAPLEPLSILGNTEATETHFSDFSALSVGSVVQADAENVEFVGHIGGATYAVVVQGNYAYIGEGPKLTILDISNPASPAVVGKTLPLPGVVRGVAVAGDYAYIAAGVSGLRVVDVSVPRSNPREVGFYDTPGDAYGVDVAGSYAYVADGDAGLRVMDVSTPSNPRGVGFCDTPGFAYDVAVAGNHAYVADGGYSGLRVVDISNPTDPREVGFYATSRYAYVYGVDVSGNYAYVTDSAGAGPGFCDGGLRVIDVSTPSSPREVGFYDMQGGCARGVVVAGGYAYVADEAWWGGMQVVDVSTPSSPMGIGSYDIPAPAIGVAVAGGYTYVVTGRYYGLRVVDVSSPSNPREVGSYYVPGYYAGIDVTGGYAYVADGYGLWVMSVSDPANPVVVGFCDTPSGAMDVAVVGSYAYVADGCLGLGVIDISNPANPREVGHTDSPGGSETWMFADVAVSGGYAYTANGFIGLQIVDISNPINPNKVGFCDTPGSASDVTVAGDYAYVTGDYGGLWGLWVLDISNPTAPIKVGFYEYGGSVAVAGSYAYIASGSGLRVLDVSTPSAPREVGFYDTPGYARGVDVAGSYAYVGGGGAGLRVVDVSTPSAPREVGFYDTPDSPWWAVTVAGGYAYVADGDAGLFILRYEPVVHEARADIGMPYSVYRGCPSPYAGCGGSYHGFYYGVCTDLAMDAYNAGIPFNLQGALHQDHLAHPGRYRYGSARNAEDMRRYFHHNQRWLPHSQTYQLGDIAFLDWNADGLCDHVGVVSEVDTDGHPLRMVHATGVCSVNPSGRAFEQDWNSHYDQHIQGHARLSETGALMASAAETLQLLRITIDSPSVALSLRDANGKSTSDTYDENLVATGTEASIPYIPGGWYADLGTEQVITVTWPLSNTNQYFVQLTGQSATTYHLRVETLQGASVTDSEVFTQTIATGETHGSAITLSAPGGTIQFSATSPAPAPLPGLPESLELVGLVGTSAHVTFTVAETGGQQLLQSVVISATDLMDQLGGTVSGSLLTITPNSFTVPTGGSQSVDIQISLVNVAPGTYLGGLVIRSDNGGTRMIPLTLEIRFHQGYLPAIFKNH